MALNKDNQEWAKHLPPFKVYWDCMTGPNLGQCRIVEEHYQTQEQAQAVLDGFGPRPRGWVLVCLLRQHAERKGLYIKLSEQARKRKAALAELIGSASYLAEQAR
jgi:hypothetical protein